MRRSPWQAYKAALSRERGEEGRIDRVDNALDDRHRTNTRIRLGVAHCIEFLVDLPDYFHSIRSRGPTGFSDLASAAKAQLGPLPGGIVLSATVGLGFPTGASRISGHAYNPYIQFPWSREIGGGWCVSGMFTQFWFPGQQKSNAISEATFVVEREVGRHADQIVEYVGDYPNHSGPSQVINYGGAYRFTATQQIDFHAGFGLTNQIANLFLRLGLFVSI